MPAREQDALVDDSTRGSDNGEKAEEEVNPHHPIAIVQQFTMVMSSLVPSLPSPGYKRSFFVPMRGKPRGDVGTVRTYKTYKFIVKSKQFYNVRNLTSDNFRISQSHISDYFLLDPKIFMAVTVHC